MTAAQQTTYRSLTGFKTGQTDMEAFHRALGLYDWTAHKVSFSFEPGSRMERISTHTVQVICLIAMTALSRYHGWRSSGVACLVAASSCAGGVLATRLSKDTSFETMAWTRFFEVRLLDFNHTGSLWTTVLVSLIFSHTIGMSLVGVTLAQEALHRALGPELMHTPSSLDQVCEQAKAKGDITTAGMTNAWLHSVVRLMEANPDHQLSKRFVDYYNFRCLPGMQVPVEVILKHCLQSLRQPQPDGLEEYINPPWEEISRAIGRDMVLEKPSTSILKGTDPFGLCEAIPVAPTLFGRCCPSSKLTRDNTDWWVLACSVTAISITLLRVQGVHSALQIASIAMFVTMINPLGTSGIENDPLLRLDTRAAVMMASAMLVMSFLSRNKVRPSQSLPGYTTASGIFLGNFSMHLIRAWLDKPEDFTPDFSKYSLKQLLPAASKTLATRADLIDEIMPHLITKLEGAGNHQGAYILKVLRRLQEQVGTNHYTSFFLSHILSALQTPRDKLSYNTTDIILRTYRTLSSYQARNLTPALRNQITALFSCYPGLLQGKGVSQPGLWSFIKGNFKPQVTVEDVDPHTFFREIFQKLHPSATDLNLLESHIGIFSNRSLEVSGRLADWLHSERCLIYKEQGDIQALKVEEVLYATAQEHGTDDPRLTRYHRFMNQHSHKGAQAWVKGLLSQPQCGKRTNYSPFFVYDTPDDLEPRDDGMLLSMNVIDRLIRHSTPSQTCIMMT